MEVGPDFTPFDPGETDTVAIDVTSYFTVAPTATIASVQAFVENAKGSPVHDALASTRLVSSAFLGKVVMAKVTAPTDPALAGARYRIRFAITTSDGNVPQAYGHFFVRGLA